MNTVFQADGSVPVSIDFVNMAVKTDADIVKSSLERGNVLGRGPWSNWVLFLIVTLPLLYIYQQLADGG